MSEPILPDEVRLGDAYEQPRAEQRAMLVDQQRERRVPIGDSLSLVFENRRTLLASLEEMLRTERTDDPERAAAGAAAYNDVLPAGGDLAATLYVEAADPAELAKAVDDLAGIQGSLFLEIGGDRVSAEPDDSSSEEPAAAWHVAFSLDDRHREAWLGGADVIAAVEHPACSARTQLSEEQRRAIGADL
jgi:Protein of unknown function (DUF3501)